MNTCSRGGSYQGGPSQGGPGFVAGVGTPVLGAAGWAGSFQEEGDPLPSGEGAGGAPPCLGPLLDGPQRLGRGARGRGGGPLGFHLQLGVGSLQDPTGKHLIA